MRRNSSNIAFLRMTAAVFTIMLVASCVPASASFVWWNNCDSLTGWSGTSQPSVVTTNIHSGTGAFKYMNSLNRVMQATASPTAGNFVYRFWLYDSTLGTYGANAVYTDIRTSTGSAANLQGAGINNGGNDVNKYQFRMIGSGAPPSPGWVNGTVSRSVGWHRFELYYSEVDHTATWYVDGVQAYQRPGLGAGMTFSGVIVGNGSGTVNVSANDWRIDTMAILDSPVKLTFSSAGATGATTTVALDNAKFGATSVAQVNGYYDSTEVLTVTANAPLGFHFVNWSATAGIFANPNSATTTFTPAGDATVTANYAPDSGFWVHVFASPTVGGTVTGESVYNSGTSATIIAAAATGYTFTKWSTNAAGSDTVSTSSTYTFTVTGEVTYYAIFTPNNYALTITSRLAAGGSVSGSNPSVTYNTDATVTATANPNYCFMYWSSNADGTGLVSRKPTYTFKMPAKDYALYANFVKGMFYDGFEGLNNGSLDMNDATGTNIAENGDLLSGQPWWGTKPGNGEIWGADTNYTPSLAPFSGSKQLTGYAGNGLDYLNIAYRINGGNNLYGGFLVDWYFYDMYGATGVFPPNAAGTYNSDCLTLAYCDDVAAVSGMDYPYSAAESNFLEDRFSQRISLGMSNDDSPGFDGTKYQARIWYGDWTGCYANGWFNLPLTRSVGWHHGRITADDSNNIKCYIDDMQTPLMTNVSSANCGYNVIEFQTYWTMLSEQPKVLHTPGPIWPDPVHYDDIYIGAFGTTSIDKWAMIGHYPNATQATRMTTDYFAPESTEADMWASNGKTWNGKSWQTINGGIVNFNALYGATTTNGASYLFTYIQNDSDPITDADLTMGSDDGIEVFLNGSPIYTNDVLRPFTRDQDHYGPFTIPSGLNRLMVKITQGGSDYKGEVRLTHADGTAITGLTFFTSEDTAPMGSISVNGGASTTNNPNVTLALSATDAPAGMGRMSFSNDNATWSTPEAYAASKAWTLAGGDGAKTVYVKFYDKAGNTTIYNDSIQLTGYSIPVASINDLLGKADNQVFSLAGRTVTATANGAFWLEEENRTVGIKVVYSGSVTKGNAVDVVGHLDSTGSERVLAADSATDKGAGASIKALGIAARSAGGGALNAATSSITDGRGLYNIGLLVRLAGKVANTDITDPANKFFYLDDASGLSDGTASGIKVLCGGVNPPASGNVIVTGVVSTARIGTKIVPVLVLVDVR